MNPLQFIQEAEDEEGPWDVALVIVDDQLNGCGVFRTKEGLIQTLSKFSEGCPERVQVVFCTYDD